MTVKFNVVERGNPASPASPKKFYPSIQSTGRLSLRDLAKEIGKISTVSSVDTMAVLEALLSVIPDALAKGNIVELGDFGSFWLKSNADGCQEAKEVTSKMITTLVPHFNSGKEFKRVLDDIKFEKVLKRWAG